MTDNDMKKVLFALIPVLLLTAACQKEQKEIKVTDKEITAANNQKTVYAQLTSNCDYTVEISSNAKEWLSEQSHNDICVILDIKPNTSEEIRSASVDLCSGGLVLASFVVYQDGKDPELVYPAPENKKFIRAAYFPYYRRSQFSAMSDEYLKDNIDVACFAFASINDNFVAELSQSESRDAALAEVVTRCHKLGIKVVVSFAGSWLDKRFVTMSQSSKLRKNFIDSVMEIVNKYDLDGVDNDWEFPSSKDGSQKGNLLLMRQFSNILHAPGVNKTLSQAINCAVYQGSYTDGLDSGVFDCCDWLGAMVYDDYSTSAPGKNHSTYEIMVGAYNYWVGSRKMPKYKFVGGLPAYGRASGITQSGTTLSYSSILSQGGDPDKDEAVVTSSSYSGGAYTIYYNGRETIKKKVDFLKEKETGGYFFWEAGQDVTDERSLIIAAAKAAMTE